MAANQNRTKIYRIRRKSDGLFLAYAPLRTPGECCHWEPNGCFWKKKETIRKHLITLCEFWLYEGDGYVHSSDRIKSRMKPKHNPFWYLYPAGTPYRLVKTVYEWMDKYEVVATDITVHGQNVIDSEEFMKTGKGDKNHGRKSI